MPTNGRWDLIRRLNVKRAVLVGRPEMLALIITEPWKTSSKTRYKEDGTRSSKLYFKISKIFQ